MGFWRIIYKTSEQEHEVVIEAENKDESYITSLLNEIHPDWSDLKITQVQRPEWIKHSLQDWHIPKHRLQSHD